MTGTDWESQRRTARLRGVTVGEAGIRDGLHFNHPLVELEGSPQLYAATRFSWDQEEDALAPVEAETAEENGALLRPGARPRIEPGLGVITAGPGFCRDAEAAGIEVLPEAVTEELGGVAFRMKIDDGDVYDLIREQTSIEAADKFDDELGRALEAGGRLSERGRAALSVMRKCGRWARSGTGERAIAAAEVDGDKDLQRRMTLRLGLEINMSDTGIDERVETYKKNLLERRKAEREWACSGRSG